MTAGQFVSRIYTENTGGGCMVDFVVLKDGRLIGLNDESVVLYPTLECFYEGDADGNFDFPVFWRPCKKEAACTYTGTLGTYIDSLRMEATVDVLILDTGEAIGIDGESVCLYESYESLMEGRPDSVIKSISLRSEDSA